VSVRLSDYEPREQTPVPPEDPADKLKRETREAIARIKIAKSAHARGSVNSLILEEFAESERKGSK
jgi:hypothetical protein